MIMYYGFLIYREIYINDACVSIETGFTAMHNAKVKEVIILE